MTKFSNEIIFLYSEDARIKLRDLARLLNKTPQRLNYSLNILENQKIIYNPYPIIDYAHFGMLLFRVYFKGVYVNENDKEEIIRKLKENSYITSIYELNGNFDLVIEMQASNPSRFNRELRKIISYVPTLNNFKIVLNLLTYIYPRSYLINDLIKLDKVRREIIIGGDKERLEFNNNEKSVIKNILINPTSKLTSLAAQSDLNIKTVKSIIKDLKARKIINAIRYEIDINKLDINKFRLFLKTDHLTREKATEMMDYMFKIKEIVQVSKTVGDWDIEIDIESPKSETIRKLIIDIRNRFKDVIVDFNSIEFYKYYKKSFLPLYLFEKGENLEINRK